MTYHIAIVLAVLTVAIVLFVTERLRMDVVAMLVLGCLALTGLVTPADALSGFSNPAVITVWAVFILSGGLTKTGVAGIIGHHVLRLAGAGEARLVVVIMLTAGVLSAFMNNVGVAALLLPVVMDIARRTRRPPSKLLMPLAFGALMGGMNTLIGTPPNILISDAMRDYGLRPFQMFDFAPVGVVILLVGVAFMALVGRHLLPRRDIARQLSTPDRVDLGEFYALGERLFVIHLPADSGLGGNTLADSRLGAALGLNVIAVIRGGETRLAPEPGTTFQPGDRLLVQGRLDMLDEMRGRLHFVAEDDSPDAERLVSSEIRVAEVRLSPGSSLVGQTLGQIGFRRRYGVNVLAIRRDGVPRRTNVGGLPLQPQDTLLIQGPRAEIEEFQDAADFDFLRHASEEELEETYRLQERLITLRVQPESTLVGQTLAESRLGDALDLDVLGIVREGTPNLMPGPEERFQAGDILLVKGKPETVAALDGLQHLEIERQAPLGFGELESEQVGLAEAVLSPHTTLAGKTLRQIHFREKYGLTVVAIWHQGRAYRSNVGQMALQFGDALLLYGPREKLKVLGSEPDFLMLTEAVQEAPRLNKAPLAVLVMVAVLVSVVVGALPIAIAAIAGGTAMVIGGCLTMEEAYQFIEWKAVFLIAGMLPLGIAAEQTGAAAFMAQGLITAVGGLGPLAVVGGLFVLTALTSQVMPNPAVAVLLAPIAMSTADKMGMSPYALMMTVALSASASFLSPVAHPANVLVMGPGGYRFTDYLKVGSVLTVLALAVTLLALPLFWPLFL